MARQLLLLPLLFGLAAPAAALEAELSAGLGMTAAVVDHDALRDDNFAGPAAVGTVAFSDRVAARLGLYLWNHQDFTDADIAGGELVVLAGAGLAREGVRAYALLGWFAEGYDSLDVSVDASGPVWGLGAGHTWPRVILDLWVEGRDNDAYADVLAAREAPAAYRTMSAGLALSYRF